MLLLVVSKVITGTDFPFSAACYQMLAVHARRMRACGVLDAGLGALLQRILARTYAHQLINRERLGKMMFICGATSVYAYQQMQTLPQQTHNYLLHSRVTK